MGDKEVNKKYHYRKQKHKDVCDIFNCYGIYRQQHQCTSSIFKAKIKYYKCSWSLLNSKILCKIIKDQNDIILQARSDCAHNLNQPANVIIIVFEVSPIYFKFSRLPKQNWIQMWVELGHCWSTSTLTTLIFTRSKGLIRRENITAVAGNHNRIQTD